MESKMKNVHKVIYLGEVWHTFMSWQFIEEAILRIPDYELTIFDLINGEIKNEKKVMVKYLKMY